MKLNDKCACYIEGVEGYDDHCVFDKLKDSEVFEDCSVAVRLKAAGKGRNDCIGWMNCGKPDKQIRKEDLKEFYRRLDEVPKV